MKIEGLGPKRVGILYEKLDVTSLKKLKQAAEDGRIADLEGSEKRSSKRSWKASDRLTKEKSVSSSLSLKK